MPRGPQGQERPDDAIGAAVQVARTTTGEAEETPTSVQTATNRVANELSAASRI